VNEVFQIIMSSNEFTDDIIPCLEGHFSRMKGVPVKDFVVPCYVKGEIAADGPLSCLLDRQDPFDDLFQVVHSPGGVLSRFGETLSINDIDIRWYGDHQIVPGVWRVVQPANEISEQQIRECFGGSKATTSESNIAYSCPKCAHDCAFAAISPLCFTCPHCQAVFSWKALANLLTLALRDLLADQGQEECQCDSFLCFFRSQQICPSASSVPHGDRKNARLSCCGTCRLRRNSIYALLQSFEAMFLEEHDGGVDVADFASYMAEVVQRFLRLHGYQRVRLSSIMASPPASQDCETCFSFLD